MYHNCDTDDSLSLLGLKVLSRIATATQTIWSMCCTVKKLHDLLAQLNHTLVLAPRNNKDLVFVLDLSELSSEVLLERNAEVKEYQGCIAENGRHTRWTSAGCVRQVRGNVGRTGTFNGG